MFKKMMIIANLFRKKKKRNQIAPERAPSCKEEILTTCPPTSDRPVKDEPIEVPLRYTGQPCGKIPNDTVYVEVVAKTLYNGAFFACTKLISVTLPEGLETIESGAFLCCQSIPSIKIPSSVRRIGSFAFGGCYSLVSVEFCSDIIEYIGEKAFENCLSLKNLKLPSGNIAENIFTGCSDLEKVFPDHSNLIDALQRRFEGQPIHELCYKANSRQIDLTTTMLDELEDALVLHPRDCLGQTPFHILLQSPKPNIIVLQKLLDKFGSTQISHMRDKFGNLPLHYHLMSKDETDDNGLVDIILEANIVKRLIFLGWQPDFARHYITLFLDDEEERPKCPRKRKQLGVDVLYRLLEKFELTEKIFLLELGLIQNKINELPTNLRQSKSERNICRIKCGYDIIIRNVRPFLFLKKKAADYL